MSSAAADDSSSSSCAAVSSAAAASAAFATTTAPSPTDGASTYYYELITEQELNECDRQPLHFLGHVQGGAGHVVFFTKVTKGGKPLEDDDDDEDDDDEPKVAASSDQVESCAFTVVAADEQILQVPWIKAPVTKNKPRNLLGKPLSQCLASCPVVMSTESSSVGGGDQQEEEEEEESSWGYDSSSDIDTDDCESHKLIDNNNNNSNDNNNNKTNKESTLIAAIWNAMEEMKQANLTRTFLFVRVPNHANNQNEELKATTSSWSSWALTISTTSTTLDKAGRNPLFCMEIEALSEEQNQQAANDEFQSTLVRLGGLMGSSHEMQQLCASACTAVFELFRDEYDRGMVYVFKDDLSGEVTHEIKLDHVQTSYKGLRFPSTDIPKPARELFLKNGLRYNYDIEAPDNPILSISTDELDLTQCRMRAIHKLHVIYLRNMGVVSSLAIAVVVQGVLWGLLTFHRYGKKPFKPNLHQRIACETIASMLSVRIERQYMEAAAKRSIELNQVLQKWDKKSTLLQNLRALGTQVLAVCDADCLVAHVHYDGGGGEQASAEQESAASADQLVMGDASLCPSETTWRHLATQPNTDMVVCHTRNSVVQMGLSPEDCPAAGFCYFRYGATQLFLGRALRSANVTWAGDPDLPKLRIGGILNPRASFEQFMEKARQETRYWSRGDQLVIGILRYHICSN